MFSSAQNIDAEGMPLPIASISLSLDDEIQYRCAGYIQAEIERYAESLGTGAEDDELEYKDSGDDSSDDEQAGDAPEGNKTRAGKTKKSFVEGL